jgi:hypothetical protein
VGVSLRGEGGDDGNGAGTIRVVVCGSGCTVITLSGGLASVMIIMLID